MATPKPKQKTKLLKSGFHPLASNALKAIGIPASRIGQTYGTAVNSKGYHIPEPGSKPYWKIEGREYCAATDISAIHPTQLSEAEVKAFLEQLGQAGFAAWYRVRGSDCWSTDTHIHAVYAGIPMKEKLKDQVRDYLHVEPGSGLMKNGLNPIKRVKCRHALYHFWTRSEAARDKVRSLFQPVNGAQRLAEDLVNGPLAPDEDEGALDA